jgi:transcriptional regulator with XRE-family HTH domain
MEDSKVSAVDLAKTLGCSRAYISLMRKGERSPGRNLAVALAEITEGSVPVDSW